MPHGLVHESEEKLRGHFFHTGTPSATGLIMDLLGAIGTTRDDHLVIAIVVQNVVGESVQ